MKFVSIMEQNHHFQESITIVNYKGSFKCVCCGESLFSSNSKFDSGSGWPSFWEPVSEDNIEYISDTEYGMVRTEVNCKKCGSHLGVFTSLMMDQSQQTKDIVLTQFH